MTTDTNPKGKMIREHSLSYRNTNAERNSNITEPKENPPNSM